MIYGTPSRRVRHAPRRARHSAVGKPEHGASERIRLIEFRWLSPAGLQAVLPVHRERLH